MKTSSWTPLMHTVLDGEATSEETAALEAQLAVDPGMKAEFEQLSRLFARLAAVPSRHPPEGLVASVSAAVGEYSRPDQPFAPASVIGSTARDFGTLLNPPPADSTHSFSFSILREHAMNQSTNTLFSNRKAWFGGGLAAIAAAVAVAFAMGGLPRSQDVNGTIVAAERYRAPQATTQDVQLGDPSVAILLQNDAFLRVIKDPQVQALVAEPDFLPASQLILDNPELVRKALAGSADPQASAGLHALLMHQEAARVLLQNPDATSAMFHNRDASLSFLSAELRAVAQSKAVGAERSSERESASNADRTAGANAATSADRLTGADRTAGANAVTSADRLTGADRTAGANAVTSADRLTGADRTAGANAVTSADRLTGADRTAGANAVTSADRLTGADRTAGANAVTSADRLTGADRTAGANAATTANRLTGADRTAGANAVTSANRLTGADRTAGANAVTSADRLTGADRTAGANAATTADRNINLQRTAGANAAASAERASAANASTSADRGAPGNGR